MAAKLIDAGLDYVRVTSQDKASQRAMFEYFRRVLVRDQKLGYEAKTGGAFGFLGTKCRHALYGQKREWAMLQASGYEAKQGMQLAIEGTQASRLDFQLTYWVGEGEVERIIREAYNAACGLRDPQRKHMRVNMIESRHAAQTVYLGSRASDIFFRIYDKFEESKKEEYRGCVRFELELKGRMAKVLWEKIRDGNVGMRACLEMLIAMLAERGVIVPSEDLDNQDIIRLKKPETLIENTVSWLAAQVAPTVKRLSSSHGWIFAFSVLFAGACTEGDRRAIMSTLSRVWGS